MRSILPPQAQNLKHLSRCCRRAFPSLQAQKSFSSYNHTTALLLSLASPCCKGRTLNSIQGLPGMSLHEAPDHLSLSLSISVLPFPSHLVYFYGRHRRSSSTPLLSLSASTGGFLLLHSCLCLLLQEEFLRTTPVCFFQEESLLFHS